MSVPSFPKAILLGLLLLASSLLQAQGNISAEIIASLPQLRAFSYSPDGKSIAYGKYVPHEDLSTRQEGILEIHLLSHREDRMLTTAPDWGQGIAWAPDGKSLYFLDTPSKRPLSPQIIRFDLASGQKIPLTPAELSVRKFALSPDGRQLAFTFPDPDALPQQPRVWFSPEQESPFFQLAIMDLESKSWKLAFEEKLHVLDFKWGPQSDFLVLKGSPGTLADSRILFSGLYRLDPAAGKIKSICPTRGKIGEFTLSPDGQTLAFLSVVDVSDPAPQEIYLAPVNGGIPQRLLPDVQASFAQALWLDAEQVLVRGAQNSQSCLFRVDIASKSYEKMELGALILEDATFAPSRRELAVLAHRPEHPPEIYATGISKLKFKRRTYNYPQLESIKLARQEVFHWQGLDQWELEGILTYPLQYKEGQSFPLIVLLHGGPAQLIPNGFVSRPLEPVQLYAAMGFGVFQPNYRGSLGRGLEFSRANRQDLGGKDFQEILLGIDALVKEGWVDSNRVGLGGSSYGGYLAAWGASRYSSRFSASVVHAGISNWTSFFGTTDRPRSIFLCHWATYPWEMPDLFAERSPLSHLQDAQTPVLWFHGAYDRRIPPGQAQEFHRNLSHRAVPCELIYYPQEGHSLQKRASQLDFMQRSLNWYQRNLR